MCAHLHLTLNSTRSITCVLVIVTMSLPVRVLMVELEGDGLVSTCTHTHTHTHTYASLPQTVSPWLPQGCTHTYKYTPLSLAYTDRCKDTYYAQWTRTVRRGVERASTSPVRLSLALSCCCRRLVSVVGGRKSGRCTPTKPGSGESTPTPKRIVTHTHTHTQSGAAQLISQTRC